MKKKIDQLVRNVEDEKKINSRMGEELRQEKNKSQDLQQKLLNKEREFDA